MDRVELNNFVTQKEGLISVISAVQKLYQILAGRYLEIISDHKALEIIYGENKNLPKVAAGRIQTWSLVLSNFNYTLKYVKSKHNVHADYM